MLFQGWTVIPIELSRFALSTRNPFPNYVPDRHQKHLSANEKPGHLEVVDLNEEKEILVVKEILH